MSTCPECAQILGADATRCPSCGHDLHRRPMPPERRIDRDEEHDADELLAAAIATEGTSKPPPPWTAGADDGATTAPPAIAAARPVDEIGDVVPGDAGREKRPFWRRRR